MTRRYHRRKLLASPVEWAERAFPRSRIIRSLAWRLSYVRSVYGVYLLNSPGDQTFEFCVGGYGDFIADAIRGQSEQFTFLDIGANIGLFSLLAANNPACARVIAFEPIPQTFRKLQANIARNGARNVQAVMGAVGSGVGGEVHLTFNPRHTGTSAVTSRGPDTISAAVISPAGLDALVGDGAPRVVAKIDVEGSEQDVLAALQQTRFHDRIEDIIIEVSARTQDTLRQQNLLDAIDRAGYAELSRSGAPDHYDAWYRKLR